jgi:hypothetical protein
MHNDLHGQIPSKTFNPEWMDKALFNEDELSVAIADIKSFDRPLAPERPVSIIVALVAVLFAALLLGSAYVVVPRFVQFTSMHFLALGTISAGVVVLSVIHVLAARIRSH